MASQYDLKNLIQTFEAHSKLADIQRNFNIQNFKEHNPDQLLPEYLHDDFNIATAFLAICREIDKLQECNEENATTI